MDTVPTEAVERSTPNALSDGVPAARTLPKIDYVLLPALSLLTVILILAISEVVARSFWPVQEFDACRIADPITGAKFKANCTSRVKVVEGPWVDNVYNGCGYRTKEACGAKLPQTTRVAVLGTSFSYGYMTRYEDAYTTLSSAALSRECARPVEFQNLGFPNYSLLDIYHRMDEALALQPDMVLLAINPIDVRKEITPEQLAKRNQTVTLVETATAPVEGGWLHRHVIRPVRESRAMYVAQHYLYQDPETYLKLYLLLGDSAGYVQTHYSDAWEQRLHNFDVILNDMANKAQESSVPLVILLGPLPSQVALVNTPAKPGVDGFAFSNRISAIAGKYHIPVIDPLVDMVNKPNPMNWFYVVDGHFNQAGQAILADHLTDKLRAGDYAAFAGCHAQ
jgi:hypothetical protein